MARLITAGAELADNASTAGTPPDGYLTATKPTFDTSSQRSGARCWSCTATAAASNIFWDLAAFSLGTTYFFRGYYTWAASNTPVVGSRFLQVYANGAALNNWSVRVTSVSGTTLTLSLCESVNGGAVTDVVSLGSYGVGWHRVELSVNVASATSATVDVRIDGTSVAGGPLTRTVVGAVAPTAFNAGKTDSTAGTVTLLVDDVAVNDSTGAAQNSWCGDGKVALLVPTSDNAVTASTWSKNGATNAVNLWSSVDNTPPVGIADATTGTGATAEAQIRNPASNASSNYDANITTYTTAGVGTGDTINVVQWIVSHSTASTTSIPNRAAFLASNPTDTGGVETTLTNPTAAASTYPTGWVWARGPANYAPSLTLGTAPVFRVGKRTASTRIVDVCFMGVYVDYTPAAAPAATPSPMQTIIKNQAVSRAATW